MKNNHIIKLILLAAFIMPPVLIQAEPLLQQVTEAFSSVDNIQGEFLQTKNIAFLTRPIESRGNFVLDKPDRIRWELLAPVHTVTVFNRDRVQQWNEVTEEVTTGTAEDDPVMGAVFQQLLLWFNGDFDRLSKIYTITVKGKKSIILEPNAEEMKSFLSKIELSFTDSLKYIESIDLHEAGGDSTGIRFIAPEINKEIPEEIFQL